MTAAIDKELAIHMRISFKEHQHQLGSGEQRSVIRSGSRRAARKAACFEILRASFGPVFRHDLGRPGLHGSLSAASTEPVPDSAQVRMSVRQTGHRAGGTLTGPGTARPVYRRSAES